MASVKPGRLRDKHPEDDHESNWCPDDSHGQQIIIRVLLVELLHHHRADDAADVTPTQRNQLDDLMAMTGESSAKRQVMLPDCLESDHATSDPVWADLHNVNLACNPERLLATSAAYSGNGDAYWRTPIPAPLQSLARACDRTQHRTMLLADCMAAAEKAILTHPHRWALSSVEEHAALETCQLAL